MALTQIGKGGLGSTIGIGTNSPDRSLHVAGTEPSIVFEKTNESTDLKTFRIFMNSSSLQIGTVDDAFSAGVTAIEITRDNTDAITGINVRSEGGATTTSLQQGLCKAFAFVNQVTPATEASFNISSASDEGTGQTLFTYTSAFTSAFHSTQCSSEPTTSAQERPKLFGTNSTTQRRVQNEDADDGTDRDTTDLCVCDFGDLA